MLVQLEKIILFFPQFLSLGKVNVVSSENWGKNNKKQRYFEMNTLFIFSENKHNDSFNSLTPCLNILSVEFVF